jgi:hypothetical protein
MDLTEDEVIHEEEDIMMMNIEKNLTQGPMNIKKFNIRYLLNTEISKQDGLKSILIDLKLN